jgi:hypothetical protein
LRIFLHDFTGILCTTADRKGIISNEREPQKSHGFACLHCKVNMSISVSFLHPLCFHSTITEKQHEKMEGPSTQNGSKDPRKRTTILKVGTFRSPCTMRYCPSFPASPSTRSSCLNLGCLKHRNKPWYVVFHSQHSLLTRTAFLIHIGENSCSRERACPTQGRDLDLQADFSFTS